MGMFMIQELDSEHEQNKEECQNRFLTNDDGAPIIVMVMLPLLLLIVPFLHLPPEP